MANMCALRSRIKSVESTRQITKSMKMVAASKLRRAQTGYNAVRPIAEKCAQMLQELTKNSQLADNPFLRERETAGKTCYVILLGNRGLCGGYNHNLLRYAQETICGSGEEYTALVCGRWGRDLIAASGIAVEKYFDGIGDTPKAEDVRELTEYLKNLYLTGGAGRILFLYQNYKTVLLQEPTVLQLFPLEFGGASADESLREFEFEPDKDTVVERLTRLYIDYFVYSVVLEAKVGEHSSRMAAMTAATDNTEKLTAKLTQELNLARQAAITTEISEIAGGAAALAENKKG
jgi:F-type H+-transporting ATPase subunit gamma